MLTKQLSRTLMFGVGAVIAAFTIFYFNNMFHRTRVVRAVVTSVQSVSRLETTIMTIEGEQIDVQRAGLRFIGADILPNWMDGTTISLLAAGEVIAGLDLAELEDDDIRVEGNRVTIELPAAQILSWKLDNQTTRVFDRTSGAFRWVGDIDLEGEARQHAEHSILHAACQAEILTRATTDATTAVADIVEGVEGIADVEFNVVVSPPNTSRCDAVSRIVLASS